MGRVKSSEAGALVLKRGNRRDRSGHNYSAKTGFDGLPEAPWRRMPYVFKDSVALVRTTSTSDIKSTETNNRLHGRDTLEFQRQQMFWPKSLEGLRSITPVSLCDRLKREDEPAYVERSLNLPSKVEPCVDSSFLSGEAACASLCAAIQLSTVGKGPSAIVGQCRLREKPSTAPFSGVNYAQPLIQQLPAITEQDIIMQEKRVLDARKRLQELRKTFAFR